MLRKIFYNTKVTNSNNTYFEVETPDHEFLISKMLQIQSYMGELSLSKNKDVKDLIRWYITPNKTFPYSSNFKRHNSPQSFICGMLNNMVFGTQRDYSELQAQHIQNIISMFSQFTNILETEHKLVLQKESNNDTVLFVENVFITS